MRFYQRLLAAWLIAAASANAAELQVGDPAPDFRLAGSDGHYYSLTDFRDKQFVVIA